MNITRGQIFFDKLGWDKSIYHVLVQFPVWYVHQYVTLIDGFSAFSSGTPLTINVKIPSSQLPSISRKLNRPAIYSRSLVPMQCHSYRRNSEPLLLSHTLSSYVKYWSSLMRNEWAWVILLSDEWKVIKSYHIQHIIHTLWYVHIPLFGRIYY